MTTEKSWKDRSPQEQERIALARSAASYKNPFSGMNAQQRNNLHGAFNAMAWHGIRNNGRNRFRRLKRHIFMPVAK